MSNISLQEEINKWIMENGACIIDANLEMIYLTNGGLFEETNSKFAHLWIGDLDSTIRYLKRLKTFLKKNGFDTRRSAEDFLLDKRLISQSNDNSENTVKEKVK